MSEFAAALIERLASVEINVTENCKYWKPVKVLVPNVACDHEFNPGVALLGDIGDDYNLCINAGKIPQDRVFVGRALNQYFFQKKIAQTNNATLWLCYNILADKFCCIKTYYIDASRRERSIRFFKTDIEVVSLLDKIVDEIFYHCSLQDCPGVTKVDEIIVNLYNNMIYFIMSYYPSQIMYYDYNSKFYSCPSTNELDGNTSLDPSNKNCIYLYKESAAKEILRQLAQTLRFLHDNGIIHKDIKPENILLTKVDSAMFEAFVPDLDYPNPDGHDYGHVYQLHDNERVQERLSPEEINVIKTLLRDDSDRVPLNAESSRPCNNKSYGISFLDGLSKGFPYNPKISPDFDWSLWNESQLVCDRVAWSGYHDNSVNVGDNAYAFASHVGQLSRKDSTHLLDYFVNDNSPIPYKINPNFIHQKIDRTHGKARTAFDCKDQLVVITDFGVTSIAEKCPDGSSELVIFDSEGTLAFNSPESLRYIDRGIPARAKDIFSLGVTLYCMIYGKTPYTGNTSIQLLMNMLEEPLRFETYRQTSQELRDLLLRMLHKEHKKRITIDAILCHPWLSQE